MAVAYVTGLQGSDPHYYRAISTPKHYAVHSGPEPTRHFADVDVSKHDMEDTYLPAFRAAVTEGRAGSVMCAYNAVNGEPACANDFLLEHTLRGAWKFGGYVVSDCSAVRDIFEGHRFRASQPEASAISLMRGMDNECITFGEVTGTDDYQPYIDAVRKGYLPEIRDRPGTDPTVHRQDAARNVRPAVDGSLLSHRRERARQPRASPARAADRRKIDGAVQE